MDMDEHRSTAAGERGLLAEVARGGEPPERDRMRWNEIQRLFELCRERPRDEWYACLRAECAGREGIAFEVMTLLVAAENLPPLEGSGGSSI
jgi:hypothetical protein